MATGGFFGPRATEASKAEIQRQNFHANDQPARPKRAQEGQNQVEVTGSDELPIPSWRVRSSDDSYAQEAELGPPKGRQSSSHERV